MTNNFDESERKDFLDKLEDISDTHIVFKAICNLELLIKDPDRIIQLREAIESKSELFYFRSCKTLDINDDLLNIYVENLVSVNPVLVIDDIINDSLRELKEYKNTDDILKWLYYLLHNRGFSLTLLKQIFDVVLYLDFENNNEMNFYKYEILVMIVRYYKIGDIKIERRNLAMSTEENPSDQIKSQKYKMLDAQLFSIIESRRALSNLITENERLQSISIEDRTNTSTDNALVISNLIWENTLFLLEMIDDQSIDNSLIDKDKFIETADPEYFEAFMIIELYTEIILRTGVFFQNRILRNIKTLAKFVKISNFDKFLHAINSNFKISTQDESQALNLLMENAANRQMPLFDK